MNPRASKRALLIVLSLFVLLTACSSNQSSADDLQSQITQNSYTPPEQTEYEPASVIQKGSDSIFSINYHSSEPVNPYLLETHSNKIVSDLMYEGLFSVSPSFQAENVLCESYTGDGVNFSFNIRKGVKFHDGEELTAQDVVYSISLAQASSLYSSRLSNIISAVAENRYVLSITLASANTSLPLLLDIPVLREGSGDENIPAGTGAYFISSSGENTFLRAFDSHRSRSSLPLERIYLKEYEGLELTSAFETGYIDLVLSDPAGIAYYDYGGDNEAWHYSTSSMQYIGFNTNSGFFSRSWARRSAALLIERSYIVSDIMLGSAFESSIPVSPASVLFSESAEELTQYSPQAASLLLMENGAADYNGDGWLEYLSGDVPVSFTIDFIVSSENMNKLDAARHIAHALRSAGLNVNLRELPWEDYVNALKSGDFDMYYAEALLTADFNLSELLIYGGSLNFGGASSQDCAQLISDYLASGENERFDAMQNLCEYLADYCPISPILFRRESVLTRRGAVSGAVPTQYNAFHGITDWTIKTN